MMRGKTIFCYAVLRAKSTAALIQKRKLVSGKLPNASHKPRLTISHYISAVSFLN
jgi:hypothetical protein